ncbi:MAG: hypothetical protein K9L30_14075 [Desulfobacterales bacterium]|nr:hypothetical protein [Desulfobacterales bacterium]
MNITAEFRNMASTLAKIYNMPVISDITFPPFNKKGSAKSYAFMAMALEDNAGGVSYVLADDEHEAEYNSLQADRFIGQPPEKFAAQFGLSNPVDDMIGLAAINAICQHVMRKFPERIDFVTDSLGLMDIQEGENVGMVGFFRPLLKHVDRAGGKLVIIEKNPGLVEMNPEHNITLDPAELEACTKVLITNTTILNNTIDEILSHCARADYISVLGPTAGYFPDPLFKKGVHSVGGRYIKDGRQVIQAISEGRRWGNATEKLCFQKDSYTSLI